MTNTKYTTLEQSQRLKEIGFEAEADGWWFYWDKDLYFGSVKEKYIKLIQEHIDSNHMIDAFRYVVKATWRDREKYILDSFIQGAIKNCYPSYRLDTLLGHVKYPAHELQTALCRLDIVAAIAAAVDLLVLLKEVEDNA